MWIGVRQRFRQFHASLNLTSDQRSDGLTKQFGVRQTLQAAYYAHASDTPPGFVVGSWGKGTAIRPPTDVDVFFEMPAETFHRIERNIGNKQSILLQEVRDHLQKTYPQTTIRGDGQVVTVGFNTVAVEVVPAFRTTQGHFLMPDTHDGGRWKAVNPFAEIATLDAADNNSNGNTRTLAKMMKVWKRECNVPLKSYLLELLVAEFMSGYPYRYYDYYWYDWFCRDFFFFLSNKGLANIIIPGTGEVINIGYDWLTKATSARDRAIKACQYEYVDLITSAGEEWQKIFGTRIPQQP